MMKLQPSMAEILRLTRSGNLREATRVIQANLKKGIIDSPKTNHGPDGNIINVTPRRIKLASPPRANAESPAEPRKQPVSNGKRFQERQYAGPEGTMTYWLYLPERVKPGMPLVVMLHGCSQTPQDFAKGTGMNALADELGFLVAYPCQTQAANMQRCWNWFKPADQKRDSGEPALIAAITRAVTHDHQADPKRIYVAGLSAGGAAAAIMGNAYPDIYAAIGVHSGLPCGAADGMISAFAATRSGAANAQAKGGAQPFVPVITFHGDSDTTVHAINSAQIVAAAAQSSSFALTTHTQSGVSAGKRKYSQTISASPDGRSMIEEWTIHGAGHAWAGGNNAGSYTDPSGPDASRAMLAFFRQHHLPWGDKARRISGVPSIRQG